MNGRSRILRLSRHARKQIKWRKITEEEIIEAVNDPDRLEESIKERKNAFKMIGNRFLKITYKVQNDGIILVITAMVSGEKP